tara:strand:- start:2049 stop:2309 length:261 start_codon:yes stop_codon:yes gene_type:complete
MERKEASPEVVEKINKFERISFNQFKSLVDTGLIKPSCKLKTPRTIFFDSDTEHFVYLNPFHGAFQKCGEWNSNWVEDLNLPKIEE